MRSIKSDWVLRIILVVLTIALTTWVYIEARAIQNEKAAREIKDRAAVSAAVMDIAESGKHQTEKPVEYQTPVPLDNTEPEKLEQDAEVTGQKEIPVLEMENTELDEPKNDDTVLDEPVYDEYICEVPDYQVSVSEIAEQENADTDGMTYVGNFWVTGYDICVDCCGNTEGICASGAVATVGTTVAAGEEFPFGTVLYIDGIGYRTVQDRGAAVGYGVLDVLCSDHTECAAITGYRDVFLVE